MAFFPKHFHIASDITASSQTTISVPAMQCRVTDTSLESFSNITLDVNSDSSWDFGQNIATWQANHAYSEGDWVRAALVKTLTRPGWNPGGNVICSGTPPTARYAHTSIISDGYMYVFGGFDGSYKNDVHRLNLSTLTWSGTLTCSGTPPIARQYHTSIISDGYMYVFGGYNGSNLNDVHRLNLSTLTWSGTLTCSGTPPIARYAHTSIISDGYMYVFGGRGSDNLNDVHRLNLSTLAWSGTLTCSGTPPAVRRFHTSIISDGYMYVFGGFDGNYKNDVHRLNLTNNLSAYKCATSGTSLSSEPLWSNVLSAATAESGGPTWICYYDDSKAANRAGQDYYIYSVIPFIGKTPKLLLSANATYPSGYSATTSRKIGGFHCLCASVGTIANHTLTGLVTGDIIPTSIWSLFHRAASGNNAGMVYDDVTHKWYAIYLPSLSGSNAVSVFGGTISDTLTWFSAVDYCANSSTRLLKDHEFTACATGSPEGTNISSGADPGTTGGHSNTVGVRIISYIGCEDCVGVLHQWLDEQGYRFDVATNHTHSLTATGEAETATTGNPSGDVAPAWSWKNQTGGKGQLYTQGTYGTIKVLAGGLYNDVAAAGSLDRQYNIYPWVSSSVVSYRFCCESKEI